MIRKLVSLNFRIIRRLSTELNVFFSKICCHIIFYSLNVKYFDFKTSGIPFVSVSRNGGVIEIGKNFSMNNNIRGNPIGPNERCIFFVKNRASLIIGENVGMSQTAIVCHERIIIGNNVKIGGGVRIYDTDFHSLDPILRKSPSLDFKNAFKKPVVIKDNAFIGANSTILKGVIIGENAIVGACSIVTKSIPNNEIWGGNPAKHLKYLK